MYRGDFEGARHHFEKAIAVSPSDAYIRSRASAFFSFAGEAVRALTLLDEADQLDPFLPVWCVEERIVALYALSRYRWAVAASIRPTCQIRRSRLYRAAARVSLGDIDAARKTVADTMASDPSISSTFLETQEHYRDAGITQELIGLLGRAGLPLNSERFGTRDEVDLKAQPGRSSLRVNVRFVPVATGGRRALSQTIRHNALETQSCRVEAVDEHIDDANQLTCSWMIRSGSIKGPST